MARRGHFTKDTATYFLYQLCLSDVLAWNCPASGPGLTAWLSFITGMAICCDFNNVLS